MELIPKRAAIKWIVLTIVIPLAVTMFASNFYFAIWYMKMAMAGTPHQGGPPLQIIQRAFISTASIGLWFTVGLWWFLRRKAESFSALFGTRTDSFTKDFLTGLILGVLWVIIYGLVGWPPFSTMFVVNAAKFKSLFTSLSAGFCEEFLFRGFVIAIIARAGGEKKAQLIWSSLAFGAAHLFWGPIGMLFTFVLGITFAAVTLRRGNVWAAVVAHSILNVCIEPGLIEKAMSFHGQ